MNRSVLRKTPNVARAVGLRSDALPHHWPRKCDKLAPAGAGAGGVQLRQVVTASMVGTEPRLTTTSTAPLFPGPGAERRSVPRPAANALPRVTPVSPAVRL